MSQDKAARWPDGVVPGSVQTRLAGDYYDINYSYHVPGLPGFTVTLMVHKDCYPPGWSSLAWIEKVGPEFIQKHFASSWRSVMADVRAGERRYLLFSRVDPGEDVTR
jgi:hypothetical protein